MRKMFFVLFFILTIFMIANVADAGEWFLFNKVYKPFYNPRTGRIVDKSTWQLSARRPLAGGGYLSPEISYPVINRHEMGDLILMEIKIDKAEIDIFLNQKTIQIELESALIKRGTDTKKTHTTYRSYAFQDFNPRLLTADEATKILSEWRLIDQPESGTTP